MGDKFYKKKGIAIEKIASELYLLNKNVRFRIMTDMQAKYNLSIGTVQNALTFLKEEHAIETKSRGHLGTFIEYIDYKKLQAYAGADQIGGTMPLPYSKLYEGLATGLYTMFKEEQIKLNLAFIRGSIERIDAAEKEQFDFAIVSRFAAEQEMSKGHRISIALSFGPSTYLSKHVLIVADKEKEKIEDGMKIGIDKDSLDHYYLTKELVKGKNVRLIDYPANQLIHAIREGEIDAGVWNYDEIVEKGLSDLHYVDIPKKKHNKDISEAVLVCKEDNEMIKALCRNNISVKRMHEIQQLVKSGEMIPRF
ncbi:MAG: hypothetical protein JJU01_07270 [Alkalibacterium sp.]|nr:hypothetical protein [Alkalibacterium sp.]